MQALKTQPSRQLILATCLVVFALWVAFQAGKRRGLKASVGPRTPLPGTFVLDIQFTFSSTKERDTFVDMWRPLAKHVREREPGTISYELAIADSDPLKILVFERYTSKDDYHLHKNSKPFEEFHNKLRDSGITWVSKAGQSFIESGVGFV